MVPAPEHFLGAVEVLVEVDPGIGEARVQDGSVEVALVEVLHEGGPLVLLGHDADAHLLGGMGQLGDDLGVEGPRAAVGELQLKGLALLVEHAVAVSVGPAGLGEQPPGLLGVERDGRERVVVAGVDGLGRTDGHLAPAALDLVDDPLPVEEVGEGGADPGIVEGRPSGVPPDARVGQAGVVVLVELGDVVEGGVVLELRFVLREVDDGHVERLCAEGLQGGAGVGDVDPALAGQVVPGGVDLDAPVDRVLDQLHPGLGPVAAGPEHVGPGAG